MKNKNIVSFLCISIASLYGMQENTFVKDAFYRLDPKQQKQVCLSIKQNKPFNVFNDARMDNAVQMIKIQDDGRVKVFNGRYNTEVLTTAFSMLCK